MDILKAATVWAKAEMVSSIFFMFIGGVYILSAIGFWQLGNNALTKALIIPIMIVGALLLGAGISFYNSSKSLLSSFETEYKTNPSSLIKSELDRTTRTIKTYEKAALKVFPLIIIIALLMVVFISKPTIRAIGIAIIAFLIVLVLLDSLALKRMKTYHQQLELVEG